MGFFKFSRKSHIELAKRALSQVNMLDFANTPMNKMSGGQQQRIMIAKSLINNPKILIFDEPTTGIDKESKDQLFKILTHLNRIHGITILLVPHELETMRRYFPKNSDISTAIIMSLGIGLAAVLSDFVKGAANFNSFLFGSIVAISDFEVILVTMVFFIVIAVFAILYKALLYVSFDEVGARLAGIRVQTVNIIFTFLISLSISIASRTVGVLMVSSLMVIPVACALRVSKSYFQTVIYSILFGMLFTIAGIVISFYQGLKPGGTMVLTGIVMLVTIVILQNLRKLLKI